MRLPLIPTIIVAIAVAAMVGLGIWQLDRRIEKHALLARYAANLHSPAMTYPRLAPVAPEALFRRSQVNCLRVSAWRTEGGRSAAGKPGYRHLAKCVAGAEGPGALIDMGVSSDPQAKIAWTGGIVDGVITTEPEHRSLISGLFARSTPPGPMLVAAKPAPGLAASAQPDPASIPDNHLAYAVQWFVFAAIAATIYLLALRRKTRS